MNPRLASEMSDSAPPPWPEWREVLMLWIMTAFVLMTILTFTVMMLLLLRLAA